MAQLAKSIACVLLLLLAGCESMRRPPRVGPPAPRVGDSAAEERYAEVLGRWTRQDEIYEGLDCRTFFAATLLSPEFREARVSRLAAFQTMPDSEARRLLALERERSAQAVEIVLGVHANERRFDDFARSGSIWRVALVSPAGEALPLSIERMRRNDPSLRALFPYIEQFWTAYLVRFPLALADGTPVLPKSGPVTLRISSTLGSADLVFDLDSQQAAGESGH